MLFSPETHINSMGRIRDLLLDEDCSRCEGDVPTEQRVIKAPIKQANSRVVGSADLVEDSHDDLEKQLEDLLGD